MDKPNSNHRSYNKSEVIHLLPKIDVQSVKKYIHELLLHHHIKKSEFISRCFICSSPLLKNWQSFVKHLRSPSHIDNIKGDTKQFTGICILCKYIFIADYADLIFEHLIDHRIITGQIDEQIVHNYSENDSASPSSSISSSTLIYKDEKNIHTSSTKLKHTPQMEKECSSVSRSTKVSSKHFVPESSKNCVCPKLAFFSNAVVQITSPGVSEGEFTVSQELDIITIRDYCTKTYYSFYYRLRKLYFSCLECKALRLQENDFYKHLTGVKHYNKLGDSYNNGFIKICDICQVLLLGHLGLIQDHFESKAHKQNIKCKMGLIKQQFAGISGQLKLGFSGELTDGCTKLFFSIEVLNHSVERSLKEARDVASTLHIFKRVIEEDIRKALKNEYIYYDIRVVGSRLYELANRQSDFDIHLNIGDVSVGDLEEYFCKATLLFQVERTILDAKVPIIRLKHLGTSLICDVNTTNLGGPYCSELIKLYISLDERVPWLAMAIMKWSTENDIRGSRKFKSYALICLVLFFLMSPKIHLIPSVETLRSLHFDRKVYIKGWDYSFCRDIEKIKEVHNPLLCTLNKYELLAEFFKYYSRLDAKGSVLFPHNGKIYPRALFASPSANIYPGIHTNQEDDEPLSIGGRFVLIDFFCLRENLNKSVDENLLDHFKSICSKTLLCGWQK